MTTVKIAQLYPEQLGVTGDRGNVRTLEARLEQHGIAAETTRVGIGEPLPTDLDILVIGNGPLSAMRGLHDDFLARAEQISAFISDGGALFAVGGSAELLGARIDLADGTHLDGMSALPYRVARVADRRVGYIVVDTPEGQVVGFEDHASEWTLDSADASWGTVVDGNGSFARGDGRGEFVRVGNALVGNVQGPALPLNPALSDALLRAVAERRGFDLGDVARSDLDAYAEGARDAILRLLHGRDFKTIQI